MLAVAVIFTSGGDCHKVPKLGGLEQQKLILSRFRRPPGRDQAVGGAVLSLKVLGEQPPCCF